MPRFCGNCGTEVDETAVFCPTCGQPIDQAVETEMPPAPAWPDPEPVQSSAGGPRTSPPPSDERADMSGTDETPRSLTGLRGGRDAMPADAYDGSVAGDAERTAARPSEEAGAWDEPTRVDARPPRPDNFDDSTAPPATARPAAGTSPRSGAPSRVPSAPPAAPNEPASAGPSIDLPVTMPVTLSAWLIGVGAALAAVGALISLFDAFGAAVDLVALIALAAVALSVFFSAAVPAIPHLRLITLAVVLVAFGIGLDRLGFAGASGVGELLLFIGAAAAVIGAVLLELGRDQPLGGPQH